YIILVKKGYQQFQEPQGSSIIKVKGVVRISIYNSNLHTGNASQALWDAADYVVPSIGGLIQIEQIWECNFDYNVKNQECFPIYKFNLLQSGDDKLSPGVNFRFVERYRSNEIDYRTTTKVYGLRFVLTIAGHGGRFDIRRLFLAIEL
ncbi:unnamed protein product, partial [Rotaria sordida]